MKQVVTLILWAVLAALVLGTFNYPQALADPTAGEDVNWQVISTGGTDGTSTNYQVSGTFAQTAIDAGSSTSYIVGHGFWYGMLETCDCRPGEADGNKIIEISDAVYLISYIFVPGSPAPVPYAVCSGDADCNCIVEISDAVYLINYVFVPGSPPPCTCEGWLSTCGSPLM